MKKYRANDKHPLYEFGLREFNEKYREIDVIENWIEKGWVEEIKEKLYTEDDLLSLLEYIFEISGPDKMAIYESTLKAWKNEKLNK